MKRRLKNVFIVLLAAIALTIAVPSVLPKGVGTVTVEAAVKISKTKLTLIKGQSKTLEISGTSKKVTWSSSKKSVATVSSSGKVTAKKKGTATITAKVGSKKYKCKVTVETPKINKTSTTIEVGEKVKLKISGTSQDVTWSSSKKSVATVSSSGKVTGKKKGTATITAKVGSKKYTCKIKVTKAVEPEIEVVSLTTPTSSDVSSIIIRVTNNDTRTIEFHEDMLVYNYTAAYWTGLYSSWMTEGNFGIPFGEDETVTIDPGETKTIKSEGGDYSFSGNENVYFTLLMDVNGNRFIYDFYPTTGLGYFDED